MHPSEPTQHRMEGTSAEDTEFALGKASLRSMSTATGVIPSLAIIRKHINELDTENRAKFGFNLGAVVEFVDLNFLRSAIMLGQNPKLLDWLFRWIEQVEFQMPIMKIVGLIAVTVKFSTGCEVKIRDLFLAKAFSFVRKQVGQKKLLRRLTLAKLNIDSESENASPKKIRRPDVVFPEEADVSAALVIYSLLVIDKNRDMIAPEVASELSLALLLSLESVGATFSRLRTGELRTIINDKINCILKWVVPFLSKQTAVLRLGDLIALSHFPAEDRLRIHAAGLP
jgi:hypothetical protein